MKTPMRIQRKRVKGWKTPENTRSVTRPGWWGNPFPPGEILSDLSFEYSDEGIPFQILQMTDIVFDDHLEQVVTIEDSLKLYRAHILYRWEYLSGYSPEQLEGKNLACYCRLCEVHKDGRPLGVACPDCDPCHVDVLGELLYGETADKTK